MSTKKILWIVFILNLGMFFLEIGSGWLARSSALTADSLDMLADAFVYGLSLRVFAGSQSAKARTSLLKGILMGSLGLLVMGETIGKILHPVLPSGQTMALVSLIAFAVNLTSVLLLLRARGEDLNLKSAWICSRNDTTANMAVIIAGFLVWHLQSMWPDILVGLGMSMLVLKSAGEIIKESWEQIGEST